MAKQLWIPGPTQVSADVLAQCALPMIGHRSQAMTDLLAEIQPQLQALFETQQPVMIFSSAATGVMEAGIRNLVAKRVLSCINGAFSERWYKIALACGKQAVKYELPWGHGFTGVLMEQKIAAAGPFDAVTVVHNETSTGALSDLPSISCALAKYPQTLLLVDTVSSLGATPIQFDKNQIDLALAGVQKALALPPGVAVAAISAKALERAQSIADRGWYFDFVALAQAIQENSTPTTPAIPIMFAMRKLLQKVKAAGGWQQRYAEHQKMQGIMDAWVNKQHLQHFPEREFRSPTTACIQAGTLNTAKFIAGLKERGYSISNGYGKLKDITFRIGHMGDHTSEKLAELLNAADEVLSTLK